jgi:hypothetical protein
MPRTEAVVNNLGPEVRTPSGPGSFLVFLVRKPLSFNQAASWERVAVPVAYLRKSSHTA